MYVKKSFVNYNGVQLIPNINVLNFSQFIKTKVSRTVSKYRSQFTQHICFIILPGTGHLIMQIQYNTVPFERECICILKFCNFLWLVTLYFSKKSILYLPPFLFDPHWVQNTIRIILLPILLLPGMLSRLIS